MKEKLDKNWFKIILIVGILSILALWLDYIDKKMGNIIGLLYIFGGTAALASGLISRRIAREYLYGNPGYLSKIFGYLFDIKNKTDAIKRSTGGTEEEIKKNIDAEAPFRGIVWSFIGTIILIVILFI